MTEFSEEIQKAEAVLENLSTLAKPGDWVDSATARGIEMAYQGAQTLTLISIAKSLERLASK